ncbi:hypothetical protein BDR06DRAFT_972400 [Suillus hirtellus]|nr:hypothetical protein BDR06DRAFT_972400 [Suillus hirtellus]
MAVIQKGTSAGLKQRSRCHDASICYPIWRPTCSILKAALFCNCSQSFSLPSPPTPKKIPVTALKRIIFDKTFFPANEAILNTMAEKAFNEDLVLTSVINAYLLDLAINKCGSAHVALRIEQIHLLLVNDSFLHGFMMLIMSDGQPRPFGIPFGSNAIINILEIILLEKQYHCFVFYDGSERWKNCLMNLISFISTTLKWALG